MREVAILPAGEEVRRLMIFESQEGVLLFGRRSAVDGPADWDLWFDSVRSARDYCRDTYGASDDLWRPLPDPMPGCQDDWEAVVRVKGRDRGAPIWGSYEQLGADGVWHETTVAAIKG